jgi:hypothetical protein
MKTHTLTLQIQNPCHENWDDMLEEEKGKFCLACQKTVVDFTKMRDAEVVNFFSDYIGNVCGRISKNRLNVPLSNRVKTYGSPLHRFAAGLLLSIGLLHPAQAQSLKIKTEQHPVKHQAKEQNQGNGEKKIISGRITDASGKKPLEGVSVQELNSSMAAYTDKNGYYRLELPASETGKNIQLSFYKAGFEEILVSNITIGKNETVINKRLSKESDHVKGDVMIMGKIAPAR